MDAKVKLRLNWMNLYKKLGHAGKVCQHYNISRFTLRKWFKRYEAFGEAGLVNLSSKPKSSPTKKINVLSEQLILDIRRTRRLGARRMQTELKRLIEGKKLSGVKIQNKKFDMLLEFDLGSKKTMHIQIWADDKQENHEAWKFFTPDSKCFTAGPGTFYRYELYEPQLRK